MKTKQKSSKEKNRAESRALNHGAFLSQYLNGFCFLFINERHGFLKINRMVFSFFFMFVAWPIFSFFCSFTETQKKITFSPWRNWIWKQNDTEKMIYEKNSRFIFFILDSMFCFCCVYYFLRVSDARNENYQENYRRRIFRRIWRHHIPMSVCQRIIGIYQNVVKAFTSCIRKQFLGR